jgi:hypothetical protein
LYRVRPGAYGGKAGLEDCLVVPVVLKQVASKGSINMHVLAAKCKCSTLYKWRARIHVIMLWKGADLARMGGMLD